MPIKNESLRITLVALCLALMTTLASAQTSPEIESLRARIDQQAAELELLRAAVQRLSAASAAAPSPASSPQRTPALAPAPVTAGTGTIKFNGLLQAWLASGDSGFQDTFRIRRAELKFSGDLGKTAGWVVMIDPSKSLGTTNSGGTTAVTQATRTLQDAFLTFGRPTRLALTAGQFKVPISREGLESSAALDTIERALFITDRGRGGAFGDIRDIGIGVRRSIPNRYDFTLALFNGTGESQNETDRNERKALSGRFNVHVPGVEGLQVGTSAAWGGGSGDARRDRATLDLLLVRGSLKLKAEVAAGRDGALERLGFYAHGGYRITPRVELVARLDQWDPDTNSNNTSASTRERDYLAGANLGITESLRLQANYVRKTFAASAWPDRSLFLINMQTSW